MDVCLVPTLLPTYRGAKHTFLATNAPMLALYNVRPTAKVIHLNGAPAAMPTAAICHVLHGVVNATFKHMTNQLVRRRCHWICLLSLVVHTHYTTRPPPFAVIYYYITVVCHHVLHQKPVGVVRVVPLHMFRLGHDKRNQSVAREWSSERKSQEKQTPYKQSELTTSS